MQYITDVPVDCPGLSEVFGAGCATIRMGPPKTGMGASGSDSTEWASLKKHGRSEKEFPKAAADMQVATCGASNKPKRPSSGKITPGSSMRRHLNDGRHHLKGFALE